MQFTKEDVQAGLLALANELATIGVTATIQVVGGAAISLRVERLTLTDDVDATYPYAKEVEEAVQKIGLARNWKEDWLNDAVNMFTSHYTDDEEDWDTHITRGDVTIRIARPPLLLAMKLLAGRGRRDATDIDLLLTACNITSFAEAMAVFEKYYPREVMANRALRQLQERFATSETNF